MVRFEFVARRKTWPLKAFIQSGKMYQKMSTMDENVSSRKK